MKICCLTIASQRSFCRELLFQTIALQIISYEKMKMLQVHQKRYITQAIFLQEMHLNFGMGPLLLITAFCPIQSLYKEKRNIFPRLKYESSVLFDGGSLLSYFFMLCNASKGHFIS